MATRNPTFCGSGDEYIMFRIVRILRGIGLDCNAVEAEVLNVGCGLSDPAIGDLVPVWDGLRCVFNLPERLLIGLKGYAVRMSNPNAGGQLSESEFVQVDACRWEVIRLCCAEEI